MNPETNSQENSRLQTLKLEDSEAKIWKIILNAEGITNQTRVVGWDTEISYNEQNGERFSKIISALQSKLYTLEDLTKAEAEARRNENTIVVETDMGHLGGLKSKYIILDIS